MASPRPGPLSVNVADLLRTPHARKRVCTTAPAPGDLTVSGSWVSEGAPVDVDVELESLPDGIVATGAVEATWEGPCRRCLEPGRGRLRAHVRELFTEGAGPDADAYAFHADVVDLTELVHDAVLLELPVAPLCREDCAGLCPTCGANRNAGRCGCGPAPRDARWAALDGLRLDEPQRDEP